MKAKLSPDHPDVVAEKAAAMPWKSARVDIDGYKKAISVLRQRGYSYGEIADWLSKEIKRPVKRGQVYYVHQTCLAEEQEAYLEAQSRGEVRTVPSIGLTEEEAEQKAKEQDKVERKKKR